MVASADNVAATDGDVPATVAIRMMDATNVQPILGWGGAEGGWSFLPPLQTYSDGALTLTQTGGGKFLIESGTAASFPGNRVCAKSQGEVNIVWSAKSCDTSNATEWYLQPAGDATNNYLIRAVGASNADCLSSAEVSTVEDGQGVTTSQCDENNTAMQWAIIPTVAGTSLPEPSDALAIGLGPSTITVNNNAAYAVRAEIHWTVTEIAGQSPRNQTTGTTNIDSFPAGQSRSITIPAGQFTAQILINRYTGYYAGAYDFYAGDEDNEDTNKNDREISRFGIAGIHGSDSFWVAGSTCNPDVTWGGDKNSQTVIRQLDATDNNCDSAPSATDWMDMGAKIAQSFFGDFVKAIFSRL